jgi:hypothetical protein
MSLFPSLPTHSHHLTSSLLPLPNIAATVAAVDKPPHSNISLKIPQKKSISANKTNLLKGCVHLYL